VGVDAGEHEGRDRQGVDEREKQGSLRRWGRVVLHAGHLGRAQGARTEPSVTRPSRSIGVVDRTVVLYDEDCGFCRWSADLLRRWDRRGLVQFAPLASDEATGLLAGLDRETRFASWHVVTGDGSLYSAGAAVPELLLRLPGGSAPAALARRMPRATDRAYRIVAANRDRLGRMLGGRACAVDPSRSRR
jgi:predicted DCC family thiol-disulfide oxidoreductase YuxK